MQFKQILLFDLEELIKYWASAINVVSPNQCVEPLPRIKISLFLISTSADELISIPKIIKFLPTLPSGNENYEYTLSPIP